MGFLSPLWLLLGTAVAVPLIIHLLQRHQGPRVVFPAVRYLQRAEREHARRIKLRQLILLLLRMAVVLLLAMVAARPFVRGAGIGHEPSAVVLVLDNSMSSGLVSGDRRVLDELKDRALETLARSGPDDRFWLLRAGAPWEPALPGDAAAVAQRVRETQPTAGAADLIASISRARSILEQGAAGRATEIEVLSDLQNANVRGSLDKSSAAQPQLLLWSPRRKPPMNAAVTAVTVGGGLAPRANQRSTVVAEISGSAGDSLNVRLNLDGRVAGVAVTRPGSAAVLPFPARAASLVSGDVQIDADALRADDRRFFVATIAPPPRVLLGRPLPFVSEALAVLAGAGRITPSTGPADVVLAPGGAAPEIPPSSAIVIIAPETPLELPAVNRRLAALGINWRYEQSARAGEHRFAGAGSGDELLRSLAPARVLSAFRLTPLAAARTDSVMLRLDDGMPWAVRGARAQGGRFVLLASPFTEQATTLPATSAMIPLIDRLTGAWAAPDAPRAEAQPGERVTLPRRADQVIDPDGNRIAVSAGAAFDQATRPGVYRVVAQGKVIGAFVVNSAPNESTLLYADPRRVQRALEPLHVRRVSDSSGWQRAVFAHRVGRELWRGLLIVLLALLIVEAVAAASGRRAHTGQTAAQI
ncbi:MAG TPA: BatA and WFA domain-containing protein [Longimicrobiales bacterium]